MMKDKSGDRERESERWKNDEGTKKRKRKKTFFFFTASEQKSRKAERARAGQVPGH
jgi:hypothetical protein